MRLTVILLLVILPLISIDAQDIYKQGRPSSKGVDDYIKRNELQLITDYQNHINDTLLFEPYITTDDLTEYNTYTNGEAGYYEPPDYIIVNNNSPYIDYDLRNLSRFKKNQYNETNQFVRAVVMHELTHCYVYQIMKLIQYSDTITLHRDYSIGLRMIPMPMNNYYAEFIEEGICEYVAYDMGEMIAYDKKVVLIKDDLEIGNRDNYNIKYRYSLQFVKPIIETLGLKQAILVILSHAAPREEELINPVLFYERIGIY